MNDLSLSTDLQKSFPTITAGLKKAQHILDSIKSFEDIERVFLMGAGLSAHTYRSYLTAVKQLYEFTDGLNPLQITPAHIEKFYDHLVKKVDRNTAYLRI
ncbi:MAG: phage integrase N-terminal SAM-like domain-containing protein, partial [Spirochaetota bacterium]